MSRGVNKVILVGNLGNDPEVRQTASGTTFTTISVATSEQWTDKSTGQKQERTEWHRVKFFGRLAEIAGEYLRKGSQVYIEGSIRSDKYTDKQGIERYSFDIVVNEMQMLGSRDGGSGAGGGGGGQSYASRGGAAAAGAGSGAGGSSGSGNYDSAPRQGGGAAQRNEAAPARDDDFADDDIPF